MAARHALVRPLARRTRPNHEDFDPAQPPLDPWDPDALDDEEPQPEPGDFWLEPDDDET